MNAMDVFLGSAVAVVALYIIVGTVLFILYRGDYIRAEHPEPTRAAMKLTLSSLKALRRFKAGDDKPSSTTHVPGSDFAGTISAPIKAIPDRRRKTPSKNARHDQ